jgi:site-specific DNA-cytosine methylase
MYGGKAEVPGNIDILIAGFACDDFSMLNNVRKTLEEKGESGDTFFAVKTYMKLYRPKIVILENVINAPWYDRFNKNGEKIISKKLKNGHKQDTSIETHLENAGYKTIFFRMDTKEHYLPHTRVRGYMVCVPETSIASDEDWTRLTNTCRRLVDVFKRQASAPVEAFLFPADDPGLKVLVGDHKSEKKPPKWDKCFVNHLDYSLQLGLGDKHPISNWKPDGSRELPDYHIPMPGMTERVADSLDISHKRNLLRGFDDRFCK